MPRPRVGPFGLALTAWQLWRRLPKKQRQRIWREVRTHAPRVAAELQKRAREMRAARPKR